MDRDLQFLAQLQGNKFFHHVFLILKCFFVLESAYLLSLIYLNFLLINSIGEIIAGKIVCFDNWMIKIFELRGRGISVVVVHCSWFSKIYSSLTTLHVLSISMLVYYFSSLLISIWIYHTGSWVFLSRSYKANLIINLLC